MRLSSGPRSLRVAAIAAGLVLVVGSPLLIAKLRSRSPSGPAASPSSTARGEAAPPATFVGLTGAGDIVVADARTGKPSRTLVAARTLRRDERFVSLTLSPDRKTLYFVVHHNDDCSDVGMVPVAGGPMRIVARGDSPALSPDGKQLAYRQLLNCGGHRSVVVVRDLASGAEVMWEEKPGDLFPSLGPITWSPDPGLLMVGRCGADACGPLLLDVRSPGGRDLFAVVRPTPGYPESGDLFWRCWSVRGMRRTVVALTDYSSTTGNELYPVLEINTETGAVKELAAFGKGLGCPAFDASGDHAIFVREGVVHRWPLAAPTTIARGFTEAVW